MAWNSSVTFFLSVAPPAAVCVESEGTFLFCTLQVPVSAIVKCGRYSSPATLDRKTEVRSALRSPTPPNVRVLPPTPALSTLVSYTLASTRIFNCFHRLGLPIEQE